MRELSIHVVILFVGGRFIAYSKFEWLSRMFLLFADVHMPSAQGRHSNASVANRIASITYIQSCLVLFDSPALHHSTAALVWSFNRVRAAKAPSRRHCCVRSNGGNLSFHCDWTQQDDCSTGILCQGSSSGRLFHILRSLCGKHNLMSLLLTHTTSFLHSTWIPIRMPSKHSVRV